MSTVYNDELVFSINTDTRLLVANTVEIQQYDNNSTRITFKCPKEIEGYDITQCKVEIHYVNKASSGSQENRGIYLCEEDLATTVNDNEVTFSWLVSQNCTALVGSLRFVIRIFDESGYKWHTEIANFITIKQSIYNTTTIEVDYADRLATLEKQVAELIARLEEG